MIMCEEKNRAEMDMGVLTYRRALRQIESQLKDALTHLSKAKELNAKTTDKESTQSIAVSEKNILNLLESIKPKERSLRGKK